MDILRNFSQIIDKAKSVNRSTLAIAGAGNVEIITAIKEALEFGIIHPILVGNKNRIEEIVDEVGLSGEPDIIDVPSNDEVAPFTVELVRTGRAQMLMKGKVPTGMFLKAVLDKEKGLRSGKLLSHVAVVEVESYPKLMLFTDGGINTAPNLDEKVEILKNSLKLARKLGIEKPKVAILSATEQVNPKIPETVDAAEIVKMAESNVFGEVIIEGPVAMDVALSKHAAKIKGIDSRIAEDTDIFLVPNFATGNISVKSLIYLAGAKVGGTVLGATAPIVLLSRSDTAEIKLCSIALGCVTA
ncbi:bifunctional enoyl-CoA hydratase/phosphate acetyltransferase [bacterium]|nr:bifunctional enoyl-CoA hydratase/phosphate acetyltransferase [bacterium]